MLLSLPNELILEVVENFDDTNDIFYLLMTNKHLSELAQPALIKAGEELQDSAALCQLPLLHYAAFTDHFPSAKLALKLDPTCLHKYIDRDGTALHVAIFEGHEDMAEFLLDQGADPNAVNPHALPGVAAHTPLHLALSTLPDALIFQASPVVHGGLVTLLLRRGADPNIPASDGMNSLLEAVNLRLPTVVTEILSTGRININSRNSTGSTALHLAVARAEGASLKEAELLVVHGIDVNATNDRGQTALFECRTQSSTELLLQSGANIGVIDGAGRTVLHYLADSRYFEHSALLVDQILSTGGAIDIGLRDMYHRSALDYATTRGNEALMKVFGDL